MSKFTYLMQTVLPFHSLAQVLQHSSKMESTTYAFLRNSARNICSLCSLHIVTMLYSSEVDSKQRLDGVQDYWRNKFTVIVAHSIDANSWKILKLKFFAVFFGTISKE